AGKSRHCVIEPSPSCRKTSVRAAVETVPWHSYSRRQPSTVTNERASVVTEGSLNCQLKRTYSKSIGLFLVPLRGGAIQFANFPGSTTRPLMSDCTNP